jgi:hypothetical protein
MRDSEITLNGAKPGDSDGGKAVESGKDAPGGIDFRSLPVSAPAAPAGQPGVPVRNLPGIPAAELDKEWSRIREAVDKGNIPSGAAIKTYLLYCCQQDGVNGGMWEVIACVSDILRLEEDYVIATEPGFLQLLEVLESEKTGKELQTALQAVPL